MHPQPRLKTHRRYHFYRAWCLFFAVLWNVVGFCEFFGMAGRHQPPVIMPLLFPLMFPTVFMALSWGAFPWDYSLFGRYERTPLPAEAPLYVKPASWGKIGWMNASVPFFTWRVYRTGLGIAVFGIGKVFVPLAHIRTLEEGSFFRSPKLSHDWPELRSPVVMPKPVFAALREAAEKYGPAGAVPGKCGEVDSRPILP